MVKIQTNKNKPEKYGTVPIDITYHRNGVGGKGFFAIRYDWHDDDLPSTLDNPFPVRRMYATITYKDDVDEFDETSCRVVDLDNHASNWRGDVLSKMVIYLIGKHMDTVFDWDYRKGGN